MEIKYRPEIDGLRTIAVLSVIIYHAEFMIERQILLPGGFLGVDVFFVISGFLITSLMMNEINKTGTISISRFYERRARRLLPALMVVMLTSLPFAWLYLLPEQIIDYAKSLASSLLFGSNFYWNYSLQQYGAESALLKPFLHTWSLAVEEQYYIIFPLILLAIYKWCKSHSIAILAVSLLMSLLFAEWMTSIDTSFSFYMLPSRFWELLAGGLLANIYHTHPPKEHNSLLNEIMSIFGLYLIFYPIIFSELDGKHPGFDTLMPVIGTMLIIWFSSKEGRITKILSSKIFVGVGLISYSLYLWHYPVFSFFRIIGDFSPSSTKIACVLLTIVLSISSYFLIEKPFRKKINRNVMATIIILIATVILFFCIVIIKTDGFPSRQGGLSIFFKKAEGIPLSQEGRVCHSRRIEDSCFFYAENSENTVINVGDSHANALGSALYQWAKSQNYNYLHLTYTGCALVEGFSRYRGGKADGCSNDYNVQRMDKIKSYNNPIVVYSARMPLFLSGEWFDNSKGGTERAEMPDFRVSGGVSKTNLVKITLEKLAKSSKTLVIVYPVPIAGWHVPKKVKKELGYKLIDPVMSFRLLELSYPRKAYDDYAKKAISIYDRIVGENIIRVYPSKILCDDIKCHSKDANNLFYQDTDHVSPSVATQIVSKMGDSIKF